MKLSLIAILFLISGYSHAGLERIVREDCKYVGEPEKKEMNLSRIQKQVAPTCSSSSTGCLPSRLTLCKARVVCQDVGLTSKEKLGLNAYEVNCPGDQNGCPSASECIEDSSIAEVEMVLKDFESFQRKGSLISPE